MPLRNRVTPFGDIVATPERGSLFGNRGVLHDATGTLVRSWQVRRWIACRLEFRGRRRQLLRPGRFTELFFLDEATAFAAGHRPCAECRHGDHRRFRAAWMQGRGQADARVDEIDRVLHAERLDGRTKRTYRARAATLPDGVMVAADGDAWLIHGGAMLRWSPGGYGERTTVAAGARFDVLTPRSIVDAIDAGYAPGLHASAGHAMTDR